MKIICDNIIETTSQMEMLIRKDLVLKMSKSYMDYGKNIFMADFETVTSNTQYYKKHKDTRVILWYVENLWDDTKNAIGIDMQSFINWCVDNNSKTIFFHNLSFDGDFISKWLINFGGYTFINSDEWNEKKKSKTFTMFSSEKIIYYIQLMIRKRVNGKVTDIQIYFRCSLLLLVNSVAMLGNKVDIDYYDYEPWNHLNEVPTIFKDYIIGDVQAVKGHLVRFDKTFERRFTYKGKPKVVRGLSKLTIGSTSFKLQKDFTAQLMTYKHLKLSYDDILYFRKFYIGALSTFAPGIQDVQIKCNGFYYDVNSMYPSVMRQHLPYGQPLETPPEGNYIEYWEIHVNMCSIKNNGTPRVFKNWSGKRDNKGQLYRYVDFDLNFDCYYMKQEFELLKKLYVVDYKIIKKWYFKSEILFDKFINYYYNLRVEAKAKNDPTEFLYKIFLNSGYGKWGQNPILDSIHYSLDEYEKGDIIDSGDKQYKVTTKRLSSSNLGGLNCYIVQCTSSKANYPSVMIAATITSYARQILLKAIISNEENVLYFDTDSIMVADKQKGLKIDDKVLGAWKLECTFDKIIVKGSKVYSIWTNDEKILKYAYAGINKKFLKRHLNYNWFLETTEFDSGSKLMRKKCKNGTILIPTSYKQKRRNI